MADISYYSEEGYNSLKDEVHQLKTVERPKISAQIGEAIDKGDLSENAEYDAAKDAQGHLEAKIAKLENLLANARVIDDSKIDNSKISSRKWTPKISCPLPMEVCPTMTRGSI